MTNHFTSGGEQNIAQGENAIGKQVNVTQPMHGDGCICSGTGNVTVNNFFCRLLGRIFTRGNQSPAIDAGRDVAVNYGISPELLAKYAEELGETKQIIKGLLNTLLEREVPRDQWDAKLREIAAQYKELLALVGGNQAAKQAIERDDYAQAEMLLEAAADQHSMAAAEANADLAKLQEVQLRYVNAAAYWQKAAALLPKDKKKERACYLNAAGDNLNSISRYKEAMALYEQSRSIRKEIGDRAGEGTTLNNIGEIYRAQGDHATAWRLLEQSLSISRELGDKSQEGTTLNNIGEIYLAQGDYTTALKYLERSLGITQEIGDKKQECATLNNISLIYDARGDYDKALLLYEQSLSITQEIGDKEGEGVTLNNIGQIYKARGDYDQALKYLEQNLSIMQEIGDKEGEGVTNWNIGLVYIKKGDQRKAESYMSRA